jgi:L-lactate dehydrogenase complex protein LldG
MEESTTKEKVLKRIRNALISKTPNPYPDVDMAGAIYEPITDDLDVVFAQELTKVGGQFIYCESMDEMLSTLNLLAQTNQFLPVFCKDSKLFDLLVKAGIAVENDNKELTKTRAAITYCEFLVARLGSVMVSSRSGPGRQLNVFPEVHIVVAWSSQLVPDLKQAFAAMKAKYAQRLPSMVSVITGPSRTADIEKTLVMGAHGPKELFVFLIDDLNNH